MNRGNRRAGIGAAALAAGMVAAPLGCSESRLHFDPFTNCGTPTPFSHLDARLVSGTVTYPFLGRPAESWMVVSGSTPPVPGQCLASLMSSLVSDGNLAGGPGAYHDGVLQITCDDAQAWQLTIVGLSARSLAAGSFVFPSAQADPRFAPTIAYRSDPLSCVSATPSQISLEITRASGGPLPYPEMVTPDYARDFIVRFQSLADLSVPQGDCAGRMPIIEVAFTESAADVINELTPVSACL
jgi:hypothetical protein